MVCSKRRSIVAFSATAVLCLGLTNQAYANAQTSQEMTRSITEEVAAHRSLSESAEIKSRLENYPPTVLLFMAAKQPAGLFMPPKMGFGSATLLDRQTLRTNTYTN